MAGWCSAADEWQRRWVAKLSGRIVKPARDCQSDCDVCINGCGVMLLLWAVSAAETA